MDGAMDGETGGSQIARVHMAMKWKQKSGFIHNSMPSFSKRSSQNLQPILEKISSTQSNRVIINVGGVKFETYKTTLKSIPDTRLAWITESKSENPDYDATTGEYFFDRHPNMFLMILNYYRTGKLHSPGGVCGPAFEDELAFWGIDERQIEPCCWGTYSQHRDAQQTLDELQLDTKSAYHDDTAETNDLSTAEKFGIFEEPQKQSSWNVWKQKIWAVLDEPSSSRLAKAFTTFSLLLTITVIVCFVMETEPAFRVLKNESNPLPTNSTLEQYRSYTRPSPVFSYIDAICMIELTIETALKFISCPSKAKFLKNPLNWFDMISIVSFYIGLLLTAISQEAADRTHLLLHFLRLFRVFRIFNLARHLRGLKILFHTLKASATELLLMLILIISLGMIFAALVHFVEQIYEAKDNDFKTIFDGLWWSIVTMTTLGYGDKVPKTYLGHIVGIGCAICGVLFVALPIPIIVNNFSIYYSHAQAQEKLPKKKKNVLVGAADILKQQGLTNSVDPNHCDTISERSLTISESGTVYVTSSNDSGINTYGFESDRNGNNMNVSSPIAEDKQPKMRSARVHPESDADSRRVPAERTHDWPGRAQIRRNSLLVGGAKLPSHGV